jgi:hypothetical protein
MGFELREVSASCDVVNFGFFLLLVGSRLGRVALANLCTDVANEQLAGERRLT